MPAQTQEVLIEETLSSPPATPKPDIRPAGTAAPAAAVVPAVPTVPAAAPSPTPTPHIHVPVADPAVEATCQHSGLTAGSHCSVCGEILTPRQMIPLQGHLYVDGFCVWCGEPEPGVGSYEDFAVLLPEI